GLTEGRVALHVPGVAEPILLSYADLGRRIDAPGLVDAALAVGRSGTLADRVLAGARTAIRGSVFEPRVALDPALVLGRVSAALAQFAVEPVDARVEPTPKGFAVVRSSYGRRADVDAAAETILTALARADAPGRLDVEVRFVRLDPVVDDADAELARIAAQRIAQQIVLADGEDSWRISRGRVQSWLGFATTPDGRYEPVVDRSKIEASLAPIARLVERPPANASFVIGSGGRIVDVRPGRDGRSLDVPATVQLIAEALARRAATGQAVPIEPALVRTKPALSTEAAEAIAPRMTRLSTHTTWFPIGEKNAFGANIWLPATFIDGTVLAPGETFDFWKIVGPVTRERGFGLGGAIINGRTEPQGALAGGICSSSTTIFNAALKAGLQMGDRRNHYYYIDRYPLGLDATVFISASGSVQNMTFTNDTGFPILIRGINSRKGNIGYTRFDIYGVETGRTVTFSTPIVKNVRPATTVVEYTPELPAGARRQVEFPVDGMDVWVTRTVRGADGTVLHTDTFYSHYARITGIVQIGTGGAAAPSPSPSPAPES
ncbi:MAG TPA: VanW family protein, partial [Candidatus Limnocylindrales bacterium]|nr:VanW family protein [Candidatus Limnocylindrales bacterium]